MAEEIDLLGQLKFASQHLLKLAVFIGILYYYLRKPVSSFFVARSQKIESSINSAKDKEKILLAMFAYASSTTKDSGPFVKVSN